jgi:hypothetical protein
MSAARKSLYAVIGLLLIGGVVLGGVYFYFRHSMCDPPDPVLIAQLLKIDRLPLGTTIVSVRKDLLPDTVVEAQLTMVDGAVEQLIAGLPFQERLDPSPSAGAAKSRRWELHYRNADFSVRCDETGTNVHVICAVD